MLIKIPRSSKLSKKPDFFDLFIFRLVHELLLLKCKVFQVCGNFAFCDLREQRCNKIIAFNKKKITLQKK